MLAQSLELFFSLIVRQAGLHHLEVKHRLARKDVRPLLGSDSSCEAVLVRWINGALRRAQRRCEELLEEGEEEVGQQEGLLLLLQQTEIGNLDSDLKDGVALVGLYVSIKAIREEKPFCEKEREIEREMVCRPCHTSENDTL